MVIFIEMQVGATHFDAGMFIASCAKGTNTLARLHIPAVVVTGVVIEEEAIDMDERNINIVGVGGFLVAFLFKGPFYILSSYFPNCPLDVAFG